MRNESDIAMEFFHLHFRYTIITPTFIFIKKEMWQKTFKLNGRISCQKQQLVKQTTHTLLGWFVCLLKSTRVFWKIYRHYLMSISSASVSVIKTHLFLICNLSWQLSLCDYPPGINKVKFILAFCNAIYTEISTSQLNSMIFASIL